MTWPNQTELGHWVELHSQKGNMENMEHGYWWNYDVEPRKFWKGPWQADRALPGWPAIHWERSRIACFTYWMCFYENYRINVQEHNMRMSRSFQNVFFCI